MSDGDLEALLRDTWESWEAGANKVEDGASHQTVKSE